MTGKNKNHANSSDWTPKRIVTAVIALLLVVLMIVPLLAEVVVYSNAITQSDIDALKAEKATISSQQAEAEKVLADLEQQENSAMERLDALDVQIGLLSDQINATQEIIDDYDVMIADTQQKLAEAQANEDYYYEIFLKRVRYMEEEGTVSYWEIMFQAASFSDLLDRINFVNEVMTYDNQVMDDLEAAQNAVTAAETQLQEEQTLQQEAKDQLVEEQEELQVAAEQEEQVLAEILANEELYSDQIAELASAQEALVGEISAAEQQLAAEEAARALEEQRRREEEERQRQEQARLEQERLEQERLEQERLEQERQEQEAESEPPVDEPETGADDDASAGSDGSNEIPEISTGTETGTGGSTGGSSGGGRNPAASVSGSSIIGYAAQFVGNPYVWGGNSLTNGIDCSGYVHAVLANFGISSPRQSAAFRSFGKAVDVENMQVGDIVCYSGHVGFYAGNGMLLSALGERYGITYCSVYYKPILAVRRA